MKNFIPIFSIKKIKDNLDLVLVSAICLVILIPKFPFLTVQGTTTSIRADDFILALLYLIFLAWVVSTKVKLVFTPIHWLILVFITTGVISTTLGISNESVEHPVLGILNIFRRIEYLGIFVLAFFWLKPRRIFTYIYSLVYTSAVVVLVGLLQIIDILPIISSWQNLSGSVFYYSAFRFLTSTFGAHYDLGGFVIIMAPLVLSLIFFKKNLIQKISFLILLAGYYFLLYFSLSRSAYFAALVSVLVFFLLKKNIFFAAIPLAEGIRTIYLYLTGRLSQYAYEISIKFPSTSGSPNSSTGISTTSRSASPTSTQSATSELPNQAGFEINLDPSGNIRKDVWQNAWDKFSQNPLIGSGYSSLGIGADNQYLRMMGEVGLLGLASFLAIIGVTLWHAFKQFIPLKDEYIKGFFIAEIAFLVGLCSMAFLIDIFDSSKIAYLTWFLVGLGYKIIYDGEVKSG